MSSPAENILGFDEERITLWIRVFDSMFLRDELSASFLELYCVSVVGCALEV